MSNKLEVLARQFAELVRTRPLPVLEQEIVVVQSKGMARWLAMDLASQCSVWANAHFPFPAVFVDEMFRLVLPELKIGEEHKEEITWRIFEILPLISSRQVFTPLRQYLADGLPFKRYQLAVQLADLFDQYQIYRPEMILDWDQDKDDSWQAKLWREIYAGKDSDNVLHRGTMLQEFIGRLSHGEQQIPLPGRVTIFGVSSLPPYHLHVLEALANHTEVNFFLLNPCREYWADILSESEGRRDRRRHELTADALYQMTGNDLLASMGLLGRDFFAMLQDLNGQEHHVFEEPEQDHLLARIQKDILLLRAGDSKVSPAAPWNTDRSIQVHVCHSPLREVEVLRDHLLTLFENDPDLMPRDILVMMTDIEIYSPYIEAVFGVSHQDPLRIPYSIADRSLRRDGGLADIFLAVFELAGSRFEAGRVLKILESPFVHCRFDLTIEDVERIEQWVNETAICWGIDPEHRRRHGVHDFSQNTWLFGLERLLLGYAMGDVDGKLFAGRLPFGPVEGDDVAILGRLAECTSVLFSYADKLAASRNLSDWSMVLDDLLNDCFMSSDEDDDFQALRATLTELAEIEKKTSFNGLVESEVVLAHLRRLLEQRVSPFGFLTGGVTFCAMLPMRAIPMKILCLLGMNDATFPRPNIPVSFDLMARTPRPGDRSRRHVDRYLFLESILSAREQLYISYIGQSQYDDARLPPSVLVSELLDYVHNFYPNDSNEPDLSLSVIQHRLQPFHPDYFRPGKVLKSYSKNNYQAALAMGENRESGPLFSEPLDAPDPSRQLVDLDSLCRFFVHPVREFCRLRLGVHLPDAVISIDDNEPLAMEGLAGYLLKQELFQEMLSGGKLVDLGKKATASGNMPPGTVGATILEEFKDEMVGLAQRVEPFLDQEAGFVEVDIELNKFRLIGRLANVYSGGLVHCRAAKVKAGDLLTLWIRHLALQCTTTVNSDLRSIHVGKDKLYTAEYIEGAREVLSNFLKWYWQGLSQPLLFFPRSSMAYANAKCAGKDDEVAMQKAIFAWHGNDFQEGEGNDPYYRMCFREWLPLNDPCFVSLALECFDPLLAGVREGAI